ncbi:hypothetical protein BCR39DRAFT_532712 [Naematelia encephala]|uniref:FHA domain-containing protein n=1 Tax=Naematelia encephala TaxID=71784 RepID=A0A1Y2B4W0_9TREE|nr:hypothetical protein BCR39DRAFT_532712 [Naematelia encephala]
MLISFPVALSTFPRRQNSVVCTRTLYRTLQQSTNLTTLTTDYPLSLTVTCAVSCACSLSSATMALPVSPRALVPKKTILISDASMPITPHPSKSTTKRPAPSTPVSTKRPRSIAVASDSSDPAPTPELVFKIPAFPARLNIRELTPSTSTVAHSSSPRRNTHPHTRTSSPSEEDRNIPCIEIGIGETLVFGRHRHASEKFLDLRGAVPRNLHHLVDVDREGRVIQLPRGAKHASRVHAVVEHSTHGNVRVLVVGQNGLKMRTAGSRRAARMVQGQLIRLESGSRWVSLDFYGAEIKVIMPSIPQPHEERHAEQEEEEIQRRMSLPPSSPPMEMMPSSPMDTTPSSPIHSPREREQESYESQLSSPLSERLFSDPPVSIEIEMKKEAKQEFIESAPAPAPLLITPPRPAEIDLPALLASTVVFSGSSKLSLPDLVKLVLESQPSLRTYADETQWSTWIDMELQANAMFGKVTRQGKDSSGRPLLSHYFYNPALDPDAARSKELGGLVRPLRAAQRAGGKAIDWRPVRR